MGDAMLIRGMLLKALAVVLAATALSCSVFAAGIDSRSYTCAALQSLIVAHGFVFIGNPNFQDFVVANASYCTGGERVQVRSVPTIDRPECLVNYCIPVEVRPD